MDVVYQNSRRDMARGRRVKWMECHSSETIINDLIDARNVLLATRCWLLDGEWLVITALSCPRGQ